MTASILAFRSADLRQFARPSREQLRVAAAMFAAAPEEVTSVVVPVVLAVVVSEANAGEQTAARPEYPGGYWLADRSAREGVYSFVAARDAAEAAAEAHLRACGRRGVAGWVSIRPNGSWAAFDGLARAAA